MSAGIAGPILQPGKAGSQQAGRRGLTALLVCAALLCSLSVWLVNGPGLIYFDTEGYLDAGESVLKAFGLDLPPLAQEASPAAQAVQEQPPAEDDRRTVGSRSALYGVVLALAAWAGSVDLVVLLSLGALWLAVWLVARVSARAWSLRASVSRLAATLVLAGCLGSLPFYIAFLMPDILAPILILMIALASAFFHRMLPWERLLCGVLALAAVLAHPSHLAMAGLLVPVGLLLAPMERRSRVLLGVLLVGLVLGAGLAERVLFSQMVSRVQGGEVVYYPFLTARLIDDGPGMAYLAAHCPDAAIASCALYDLLSQPGDPLRSDAPMILFATKAPYATFRILPVPVQNAISAEQVRLAVAVTLDQPLRVAGLALRNVGAQLQKSGIGMTIAMPDDLSLVVTPQSRLYPQHATGRLTGPDRSWIEPLTRIHALVYVASALAIAALLALPRPAGRPVLRLVAMIIFGILVNALICGAVSEPADRYGARVMFLLPMTVALLLWARYGAGRDAS